jgi:hypothetical protein
LRAVQRAIVQRSSRDYRSEGGPGVLGCLGLMLILFVAAGGGGFYFLSRSSPAETPSAVVLYVDRGTVVLAPSASVDFKPADTGTVLHPGDRIRVGAGSSAGLALPDGTTARLAPDTEVTLNAAWMNARGVIGPAIVGQVQGRVLYTVASGFKTDLVVLTDAVGYEIARGSFEVDVEPSGFETVKVFQGEVITFNGNTTKPRGRTPIEAGQQQLFDDIAGPLTPIEALESNPGDPFVQVQRAEAAAAATDSTSGTAWTFSSSEPLRSGQTVTAGTYSTGGGDVSAVLSSAGSDTRLAITAPDGHIYSAEGPAPVTVRIPAGPPGSYRADVTGLDVGVRGDPFAVTFAVANACAPTEGNRYVRKFLPAKEVAQSVRIPRVSDITVTPFTQSGPVVAASSGRVARLRATVVALIYAAPPSAQVLLLSLKFQGVPMPTRAVATIGANQVTALQGLRVDRVYACTGGFAIEGSPT